LLYLAVRCCTLLYLAEKLEAVQGYKQKLTVPEWVVVVLHSEDGGAGAQSQKAITCRCGS
jgi:hypothetical protein